MKKILMCVLAGLTVSLTTSNAMAEVSYSMPALEAGFKWNGMDVDNSSSNNQVAGLQFGGSIVLNFVTFLGLKTGLFYSERPYKADFSGSTVEGKITYADIPFHLMFKLEEYAGIYAGPSLSTKIGDETKGLVPVTGVKSLVIPITIGGQFKISESFGLDIFFETIGSSLANNISGSRGIGANLFFAF